MTKLFHSAPVMDIEITEKLLELFVLAMNFVWGVSFKNLKSIYIQSQKSAVNYHMVERKLKPYEVK